MMGSVKHDISLLSHVMEGSHCYWPRLGGQQLCKRGVPVYEWRQNVHDFVYLYVCTKQCRTNQSSWPNKT